MRKARIVLAVCLTVVLCLNACSKSVTEPVTNVENIDNNEFSSATENVDKEVTDSVTNTEKEENDVQNDADPQKEQISGALNGKSERLDNLYSFYDYWKPRYIRKNKYVTDEDQYYVWYDIYEYEGKHNSVAVTVSEAHGYGMMIMAMISEYDPEAQDIFDGMVRFYNDHRSSIGPCLMAWCQSDNGEALIDADDGEMTEQPSDSATDGDMDIAYAFLLADKVWGSDGEFNYRQMGIDMINDIMKYEISPTKYVPLLGDWAYDAQPGNMHYNGTRSSDFIVTHFPCFAEASGDDNWYKVYDACYALVNQAIDEYGTGLLPDFWQYDGINDCFKPAGAYFLEDELDGGYGYNSCRTPWRIGADYLLTGSEDSKRFTDAINKWVIEATDGHPANIAAGYKLDGTKVAYYDEVCFFAPFLVTAKSCGNEEWENTLRMRIIKRSRDCYFGDAIKMFCLFLDADAYMLP